jgi:hypothetical protein
MPGLADESIPELGTELRGEPVVGLICGLIAELLPELGMLLVDGPIAEWELLGPGMPEPLMAPMPIPAMPMLRMVGMTPRL